MAIIDADEPIRRKTRLEISLLDQPLPMPLEEAQEPNDPRIYGPLAFELDGRHWIGLRDPVVFWLRLMTEDIAKEVRRAKRALSRGQDERVREALEEIVECVELLEDFAGPLKRLLDEWENAVDEAPKEDAGGLPEELVDQESVPA